ncbi:hypothetical protein Cni_G09893 [Canna indica]|uniref:Uncharacterized protein n=1 Tax=Canna indica TaxID=4628 RepID=A0AAQ3K390_9LILI|nr:hypothetical protein Cni_G09893 [Canna indica]
MAVDNETSSSKRFFVDQGSLTDILLYSTFEKMQLTKASLTLCKGDLVGFPGERVNVRGAIWLRTMFDSQPKVKTIDVKYLVINIPNPYDMILGRSSLNTIGAVVSTPHLAVKFPISEIEVNVLHADQKEAQWCYKECLKPRMAEPRNELISPQAFPRVKDK